MYQRDSDIYEHGVNKGFCLSAAERQHEQAQTHLHYAGIQPREHALHDKREHGLIHRKVGVGTFQHLAETACGEHDDAHKYRDKVRQEISNSHSRKVAEKAGVVVHRERHVHIDIGLVVKVAEAAQGGHKREHEQSYKAQHAYHDRRNEQRLNLFHLMAHLFLKQVGHHSLCAEPFYLRIRGTHRVKRRAHNRVSQQREYAAHDELRSEIAQFVA